MIDINESNISNITVGNIDIEKVYLGNNIVFEKEVPTVIDTDGNVYKIKNYINIQTGVRECSIGLYPNFPADGFEAKIGFAGNNRQYVMGGGYYNNTRRCLGIMTLAGVLRIMYDSVTLNTRYDIRNKTVTVKAAPDTEANLFRVSINGTSYVTNALRTASAPTRYFYIGKFEHMTDYGSVNGNKIYYFKYWRNSVLVRDMIPVEDENGVYALFDKIELKAYYSSGSDNFTGG